MDLGLVQVNAKHFSKNQNALCILCEMVDVALSMIKCSGLTSLHTQPITSY